MIQVEEKETIRRLYFNQRHSIREIAKERGHSRKTVKKAISEVLFNLRWWLISLTSVSWV